MIMALLDSSLNSGRDCYWILLIFFDCPPTSRSWKMMMGLALFRWAWFCNKRIMFPCLKMLLKWWYLKKRLEEIKRKWWWWLSCVYFVGASLCWWSRHAKKMMGVLVANFTNFTNQKRREKGRRSNHDQPNNKKSYILDLHFTPWSSRCSLSQVSITSLDLVNETVSGDQPKETKRHFDNNNNNTTRRLFRERCFKSPLSLGDLMAVTQQLPLPSSLFTTTIVVTNLTSCRRLQLSRW